MGDGKTGQPGQADDGGAGGGLDAAAHGARGSHARREQAQEADRRSQVLDQLEDKAADADKPLVAQARAVLVLLPFVADMNFEDVYLRYAVK